MIPISIKEKSLSSGFLSTLLNNFGTPPIIKPKNISIVIIGDLSSPNFSETSTINSVEAIRLASTMVEIGYDVFRRVGI